jgi:hypothetical protein
LTSPRVEAHMRAATPRVAESTNADNLSSPRPRGTAKRWRRNVNSDSRIRPSFETRSLSLLAVVLAGTTLTACGNAASQADDARPIAECNEYERALATCTGRNIAVGSQATALATSEAERERLRQLCSQNLSLLKATCK